MASFFRFMHKTRKSIAKRFKVTGGGKVTHRAPGQRHRLRLRNTRQKRRAKIDRPSAPAQAKLMKTAAPGRF